MAKNQLIQGNFYDKRVNLKNKPSLSIRTIEIIDYLMDKESIALGIAMEKLMTNNDLYENILDEIKEDYPEIKE